MESFFRKNPALLYGIFFFLGSHFAISQSFYCFIPLAFFCTLKNIQRLSLALLTAIFAFFFASSHVHFPPPEKELIEGEFHFEIQDIAQGMRFHTPFWKYKLSISSDNTLQNIPCSMTWKDFQHPLDANFSYRAEGTLKKVSSTYYTFYPRGLPLPQEPKFSLVHLRHKLKMQFKLFLAAHLPPGDARTFLEGLMGGEFHDQDLADNLRRFGLTHILVVSGFHFSLLAALLGFLLRASFPRKAGLILLAIASLLYLFFVGPTASVVRACVAVLSVLLAKLAERKTSGLNCLGVGLLATLIYEPTFCLSLGFQLSFLATGAILLFYSEADAFLKKIFPARQAREIFSLPLLEQILYFLFVYFRKTWALGLAVQFVMLPMCLYAFHTFPLLSFVYNSFFPLLASIACALFVLACLTFLVPFLGNFLFLASYKVADFALAFVSFQPQGFEYTLSCTFITDWAIVLYLSAVLFFGVKKHSEAHAS